MESRSKQYFLNKIEFFFCLKLFFFIFEFFLYADIKNNFLKIKKIYYFNIFSNKNYFKKQHYYILKHLLLNT